MSHSQQPPPGLHQSTNPQDQVIRPRLVQHSQISTGFASKPVAISPQLSSGVSYAVRPSVPYPAARPMATGQTAAQIPYSHQMLMYPRTMAPQVAPSQKYLLPTSAGPSTMISSVPGASDSHVLASSGSYGSMTRLAPSTHPRPPFAQISQSQTTSTAQQPQNPSKMANRAKEEILESSYMEEWCRAKFPDIKKPFESLPDLWARLIAYHTLRRTPSMEDELRKAIDEESQLNQKLQEQIQRGKRSFEVFASQYKSATIPVQATLVHQKALIRSLASASFKRRKVEEKRKLELERMRIASEMQQSDAQAAQQMQMLAGVRPVMSLSSSDTVGKS